ncbi:hypothetical protein D3C73_1046090 [compost metagenome]
MGQVREQLEGVCIAHAYANLFDQNAVGTEGIVELGIHTLELLLLGILQRGIVVGGIVIQIIVDRHLLLIYAHAVLDGGCNHFVCLCEDFQLFGQDDLGRIIVLHMQRQGLIIVAIAAESENERVLIDYFFYHIHQRTRILRLREGLQRNFGLPAHQIQGEILFQRRVRMD